VEQFGDSGRTGANAKGGPRAPALQRQRHVPLEIRLLLRAERDSTSTEARPPVGNQRFFTGAREGGAMASSGITRSTAVCLRNLPDPVTAEASGAPESEREGDGPGKKGGGVMVRREGCRTDGSAGARRGAL